VSGRVLTLPNLLTVLRGCAALPIAMAVRDNRFGLALTVVLVAGLTDGLDGIIARRTGQTSDVGRLLDPIADKTLLVVTFLAVSLPGAGFEPLPLWLAGMAITRDVCIVAAGIGIYLATGFSGFTPTLLGKANTCFEIGVVLLFFVTRLAGLPEALLTAGVYATAASIAVSGFHYIFHARRQLAAR
jgi:cardiolipin synthase (CMP-forming)